MEAQFDGTISMQRMGSFDEIYTDFDSWVTKFDKYVRRRSSYFKAEVNKDEFKALRLQVQEHVNIFIIGLLQKVQAERRAEHENQNEGCKLGALAHSDFVYYRLLSHYNLDNIRSKLYFLTLFHTCVVLIPELN
ncbi:unnamed protein product [Leptosia nina]|uniref:Uncharacterized protein n=1 Tax=Leptosia nina TaxID=320188 RepID=A0AAV1K554_9NEOP